MAGAERRLVSVLFADLVGFTGLAEDRDPEEVREILTAYFDTAGSIMARYGGTPEKFIGDAVMAVWGTPVTHEDDPERAVRAALDLVDAVQGLSVTIGMPELQLRAGIMTGGAAVTIGAIGQGMVAGDLVNAASRLQSIAEPGSVLVDQTTFQAARPAIDFEEIGPQLLRGKELPVMAYRAVRVIAARGGAQKPEVLEPPFVSRHAELRLLKELFHAATRNRKPHLVSIVGIAGIGKSRLASELFRHLDGTVEDIYWHEGRSPAYGDGLTFWALAEMVRMRAGIAETDDPGTARRKLGATLERYVPGPDERRWMEPHLSHLIGVEDAPDTGDRDEMFGAWRALIEAIAAVGPTVLVFEDLQWADAGLIDFIEYLLEWVREHPLVILVLARPELMDRRPTWGGGQRNFTSVHLDSLPPDAVRELLHGLASNLPRALVDQIVARAEGVPLYAVETIRMLIDRGKLVHVGGTFQLAEEIEELDVPETLHALIAARLDVLASDERALLQHAAVLGKTFTVDSLAALTSRAHETLEPQLRGLIRRELLVLDQDPQSPGRGQYGFLQSLIREVAYQTLSKRDRRKLHLAAAHYFENLADDEIASVVASHYVEAHRATPSGPERDALAAQARDALVLASERAAALGSSVQALGWIEQALALTEDPVARGELSQRAGEASLRATRYESAQDYFRAAQEVYSARGDQPGAARAAAGIGRALSMAGQSDRAIALLAEAAGVAQDLESSAVVRPMAELARIHMTSGRPEQSLIWADRALRVAERLDLVPEVAGLLVTKGNALTLAGRHQEGLALLRGALVFAHEHDLVTARFRAYYNLAGRLFGDDPRQAFELAIEGMELTRRLGLSGAESDLASLATEAAVFLGEWRWVDSATAPISVQDLSPRHQLEFSPLIARLQAHRGELAEARRLLADLRPLLTDLEDPLFEGNFLGHEAEVSLAAGEPEQAYGLALRSAALLPDSLRFVLLTGGRAAAWMRDLRSLRIVAKEIEAARFPPGRFIRALLRGVPAGIASLEGRREEGMALYIEAARTLRDLLAYFPLALGDLEMAIVLGPDEPASQEAAREAREIFERLGATPYLERLDSVMRTAQPA